MIDINNIEELMNTIHNENCISNDKNKGMNRIPNKSIDMILCDLPYGTTQNKWDTIIPFDKLWEQYNRIIKNNGAIVLFGSEPFTSLLICSNIKNFKYNWIWQKNKCTGFLNAKRQPLNDNETISVFYKKQCIYNPQMVIANKIYKRGFVTRDKEKNIQQSTNYGEQKSFLQIDNGLRYPKRIQYFNNNFTREYIHPTQKPIELEEYLIKTYTNEGAIVLDNCCGAGTTAISCIDTNRNYILFDNGKCDKKGDNYNKYWADISQERVNTYLNSINK